MFGVTRMAEVDGRNNLIVSLVCADSVVLCLLCAPGQAAAAPAEVDRLKLELGTDHNSGIHDGELSVGDSSDEIGDIYRGDEHI